MTTATAPAPKKPRTAKQLDGDIKRAEEKRDELIDALAEAKLTIEQLRQQRADLTRADTPPTT